jgi:hypothetical protein
LRKKCRFNWWVKNDTAAYRKSEIDVFFEKLRSESTNAQKSKFACVSSPTFQHSQTALVAALDTYDFKL